MIGVWAASSLSDACRTVLQLGLGLALQSTLLLGLGLLAARSMRRRGPSLQSLLYHVTLTGTLIGAASSLVLSSHVQPAWSVTLPPVTQHPARRASLDGWPASAPGGVPARSSSVIDPVRLPAIPAPRPQPDSLGVAAQRGAVGEYRTGTATARAGKGHGRALPGGSGVLSHLLVAWIYIAVVGIWAIGVGLLLVRLLFCRLHLSRLRRRALPLQSQAAQGLVAELSRAYQVRPPLLLESPGVNSPFLTGLRHPAVLLPAECERQFDRPMLRLILAHEFIHLARRDCVWILLARLACALGWVQPLLWVLRRRMEQVGEELCDQEVVRLEGNPSAYARCLLTLSEQLMPSLPALGLGVGVVTIHSSLGKRIQQILERARQHPPPPSNRLRVAVALAASVAVVLGLFLASAIAAPSAERDDTPKQVLRGVPELDKRVTYTETKIPLCELVQKIAADTGAPLTAAPEVADEPVAVVVKEIPARELLEQLSDLLDYSWHRSTSVLRNPYSVSGKGRGAPASLSNTRYETRTTKYEIWQDLASKQREEALRNALRADVIQRFQAELNRYVAMAGWTPEQLQKSLDEARHPTRAGDPDANERARRFQIARTMMSPICRAVGQLLGRLSLEQWETVREGKTLTFSTDPEAGELGMPAETERVLRAARPTPYPPGAQIHYDDPNGPEQWRHIEQSMQAQWAAATGYRVTIQIDPHNWQNLNMLSLTAAAKPFRTGAPPRSEFFDAYEGTSVKIRTEPSDPFSWEHDEAMPSEADLAKDPVFGSRQLFKPEAKPRREWYDEPFAPAMFRLRDLLPDLARTYKVQFIADAYTPASARVNPQPSSTPEPLYRLLSSLASISCRWDRRGSLIRLRSRTWFLDRPREIPLRLVRHWKELIDEHGALPLETYLEMARTLSDLQMENLASVVEDVALPQRIEWFEIGRDRYALRLYAALSPEQQRALWAGKSLLAPQLTPAQRELFLASLTERGRYEPYPPTLERWSDARLSLESEPRTVSVERAASSTVSPQAASDSAPGEPPARAAPAAPPGAGRPGSHPGGVMSYPITRLNFQLGYAPDQQDEVTLTVAAPG